MPYYCTNRSFENNRLLNDPARCSFYQASNSICHNDGFCTLKTQIHPDTINLGDDELIPQSNFSDPSVITILSNLPPSPEKYYTIAHNKVRNRDSIHANNDVILNNSPFDVNGPEERIIAQDLEYSYLYAKNILNSRFQLAEPNIAKSPLYAYKYSLNVIKGAWYEAEETISKDAKTAYDYSRNIIRRPFPLGEPMIATNPEYACFYAVNVLKNRFRIAEGIIQASNYKEEYNKHFLNQIIQEQIDEVRSQSGNSIDNIDLEF